MKTITTALRSFILPVLFFFFLSPALKAQLVRQFYFTHYPTSAGLNSNLVNSVLQDGNGYMWVGTEDGLQRFDGTRFKTFRHHPQDPSSLPSNRIFQLLLDKKNNLWVMTAEGKVGIFNTSNFTFRETVLHLKNPGLLTYSPKFLKMDEEGHLLFFIQGKEFITYNDTRNEFSFTDNFVPLPEGMGVTDIVQQRGTRKYWIGLQEGSLAVYDRATGHLNYAGHNTDREPAIDYFANIKTPFHLLIDKKNRLWFQSWMPGMPHIYSYDLAGKKIVVPPFEFTPTLKTYYETGPFMEQEDGTIWVIGMKIFARFLEPEKTFQLVYNGYLNERSIVYEHITSLWEDREKNIWVGTDNNGLYRFNPNEQYFTNVSHINRVNNTRGSGSVMSFMPTRWGTMLVGTWSDGLYNYDMDFKPVPIGVKGLDEKGGPYAWSMCLSPDSSTIWIASQPGIYAIDQSTRSASFYNPPFFLNKTVRQIAADRKGDLWMALQNYGVFRWTGANRKDRSIGNLKRFDKIPVMQINRITVDHEGYIWVGTSTMGVFVVDPALDSLVLHFGVNTGEGKDLPEDAVSGLLDYDDSTMVITTSREIVLYNRKAHRTEVLGTADMTSGFIASLERDQAGNIWIATTNGLYRVHPRNRVFVHFNRDDGMDDDRFILASSRALPDGRLAFGSNDQYIVFNPAAIRTSNAAPIMTITDFKVMNKALSVDSLLQLKLVKLGPGKNSLVIEFSPLTYSSANRIQYKLDGLDKDWVVADKNNQAVYSYLPPGKYTFCMKTLDEEGERESSKSCIVIRVSPPFWKSWWFFSLLVILGGGLLFWFDRERMKRTEAMQKMRSDIADNLHEQVNTALHNINILSEIARLKAGKDPEKSKEYIEQIHTRSQNMIIALDDMLWSINPENDNMAKTTERMREYIDALKIRYGVQIDLQVDKSLESLELNMKLRHEAFLVFKEGIKNLVTVGAKNLHVYISREKSNLLFITQFDNEHCDMQQLNNLLHRQDLEDRLKSLQAQIDVRLHKSTSVITLEVPAG